MNSSRQASMPIPLQVHSSIVQNPNTSRMGDLNIDSNTSTKANSIPPLSTAPTCTPPSPTASPKSNSYDNNMTNLVVTSSSSSSLSSSLITATPSKAAATAKSDYKGMHTLPSPSAFALMKKMKVLDNPLQPAEYQESMNKASAALALSALFNGGSGNNNNSSNSATNHISTPDSVHSNGNQGIDITPLPSSNLNCDVVSVSSNDELIPSPVISNSAALQNDNSSTLPSMSSSSSSLFLPDAKRMKGTVNTNINLGSNPVSASSTVRFTDGTNMTSCMNHHSSNYNMNNNNNNASQYNTMSMTSRTIQNLKSYNNASSSSSSSHTSSTKRNFASASLYPRPSMDNSNLQTSFYGTNNHIMAANNSYMPNPSSNNNNNSTDQDVIGGVAVDGSRSGSSSSSMCNGVEMNKNETVTPSPRHPPSRMNYMSNAVPNPVTSAGSMIPYHHQQTQSQAHHNMNGMLAMSNTSYHTPAKPPAHSWNNNQVWNSRNNDHHLHFQVPLSVRSSNIEINAVNNNSVSNEFNASTPATNATVLSNPTNANLPPLATPTGRFNNPALNQNSVCYNRKDKSLGLLCENFIRKYTAQFTHQVYTAEKMGQKPPALSIDEAAKSLCVERRRIYDIINILEAIHVVSRKCKNMYYWHGLGGLTDTFHKLQKGALILFKTDAVKNGYLVPDDKENTSASGSSNMSSYTSMTSGLAMLLASAEQVHNVPVSTSSSNYKSKRAAANKEKSLARLSQKFIQLFLVGNEVIAMNDASDKILGPTFADSPDNYETKEDKAKIRAANSKLLKTKIRRLYDVANVLVSIGIIEKFNEGNNMTNSLKHRPSFRWVYKVKPVDLMKHQCASSFVTHVNDT